MGRGWVGFVKSERLIFERGCHDFEWLPLLIKSVVESEKILKSCLILCLDL